MCKRAQITCRIRMREDAARTRCKSSSTTPASASQPKSDHYNRTGTGAVVSPNQTVDTDADRACETDASNARHRRLVTAEDKSSESWKVKGESLLASTSSSVRFAQRFLDDNLWSLNRQMTSLLGHGSHSNEHLHILVGDHGNPDTTPWRLLSLDHRPPQPIMEVLIDIYLLRGHWFILLFHAPSLKRQFAQLWEQPSWQRKDTGMVLVILMVAALGAQCALKDPSRARARLMQQYAIDLLDLPGQLAAEVKLHLLDVMADCSVESVQIALLLARYFASTGSPGMGWTLVGMAARNAYAGGLHQPLESNEDTIRCEVRRRTWIATKTIDTFSAFFHGRPPSLDCNFTSVLDPYHVLDLELPRPLADHAALHRFGFKVDLHIFHRLKYEVYEIMARALASFRQIRNDKNCSRKHELILNTIRDTEALLHDWRLRRPPFFDYSSWVDDDILGIKTHDDNASDWPDAARILTLQSITLQVILDSHILMLHRPVLELGLSLVSDTSPPFSADVMLQSLQTTLDAALRISAVPLGMFEKEVPLAYILMASLTAAVILCLAPVASPMSVQAHQAKEGLLRIIHSCKALAGSSALAEHMSKLLPQLMTKVVRHETHAALAVTPSWDCRAAPQDARRSGSQGLYGVPGGEDPRGSQHTVPAIYPVRYQDSASNEAQLATEHATAPLADDWSLRDPAAAEQHGLTRSYAADSFELNDAMYTDRMRQLLYMLPPNSFSGWS